MTAARDWKPAPCLKCGGPKPEGQGRKLCPECKQTPEERRAAHRRGTGHQPMGSDEQRGAVREILRDRVGEFPWTEERIIAAIKRWHRRTGRAPSYRDWHKPTGVGPFLVSSRTASRPSTGTVRKVFGSWSAAMEAAGMTPLPRGRRTPPRKRVSFVCPVCGKVLSLQPWKARRRKVCSWACNGSLNGSMNRSMNLSSGERSQPAVQKGQAMTATEANNKRPKRAKNQTQEVT